jgi:hypothetical protein
MESLEIKMNRIENRIAWRILTPIFAKLSFYKVAAKRVP